MASKFTKCMFWGAVIVGAAAGIHYYLQKKEAEAALADDIEDGADVGEQKSRSYVSLNLDGGMAALNKAKDKITDSYNQVVDTVKAGLAGSLAARDFVDLTQEEDADTDEGADDDNETPAADEDATGDDANDDDVSGDKVTVEEFFNEE